MANLVTININEVRHKLTASIDTQLLYIPRNELRSWGAPIDLVRRASGLNEILIRPVRGRVQKDADAHVV